jgi:hypothetical protein
VDFTLCFLRPSFLLSESILALSSKQGAVDFRQLAAHFIIFYVCQSSTVMLETGRRQEPKYLDAESHNF